MMFRLLFAASWIELNFILPFKCSNDHFIDQKSGLFPGEETARFFYSFISFIGLII